MYIIIIILGTCVENYKQSLSGKDCCHGSYKESWYKYMAYQCYQF
jgi:hypothetical protein